MIASRIEARAVFKVAAIVLLAIGVALLLEHVIVEVRTTVRWLFAAVFLALALSPLVDLVEGGRSRRPPPSPPCWSLLRPPSPPPPPRCHGGLRCCSHTSSSSPPSRS
jgi:hypothetical protein